MGGMSDYRRAKEITGGGDALAAAKDAARRLVAEHWDAIERVATCLERFKTIGGKLVRELVEAAGLCRVCSCPLDANDPPEAHQECSQYLASISHSSHARAGASSTNRPLPRRRSCAVQTMATPTKCASDTFTSPSHTRAAFCCDLKRRLSQ